MKRKNFNKILLLFFLLACGMFSSAQNFISFINDNYAGASGMNFQPASIVDSRYKIDVTLLGASINLSNNYLKFDRSVFFDTDKQQGSDFHNKYISEKLNDKDKRALFTGEIQGLNVMYSINKKHALGFSTRYRTVLNIDGVDEPMARMIFEEFDINPFFDQEFNFSNISIQQNAWREFGLTYAGVVYDTDHEHFLKAGLTVKLIQGLGGFYFFIDDITYKFSAKDTLIYLSSDLNFGNSENLDDGFNYGTNNHDSKTTIGLDIGAVYEWRPNHKKYKYDMDGERDLWRNDQNKYKVRVGISILDLGRIKYKGYSSPNYHTGNVTGWNIENVEINTMNDLRDTLDNRFGASTTEEYFNMNLPTTISLQVDYNLNDKFYLNFTPFFSLRQGKSDFNKNHYYTNFSITPRYEKKWYGASIPIQVNQVGQFNFGLGLRMGPVWIGSYDLLSVLGIKRNVHSIDIHCFFKIPILYKTPQDKDKDQVSDKLDECPLTPGKLQFKGCPDSDEDGIRNMDDKCPYEAGIKEFDGCPDTDKDGVQDKFDECPETYGLKIYSGCPDTDEDGIIDKKDDCPEEAGLEIFGGCPDSDGDSIMDKLDDCPEIAGLPKYNGCPDTDGDGIRDIEDQCPDIAGLDSLKGCPLIDTDGDKIQDKYDHCPKIAGPVENDGCPYVDTDGDGIFDKDDWCPMTPGVAENNGCPVIEEEEQEILNTAFSNLEFETGKSIIKESSYESLNELAKLMEKKTSWNLLVEGHTDNVGRPASNMALSKNRASAVKKFLTNKGIATERITVKWYGETKPIGDNNTEEGRQKNRRVEMTVIFD